MSRADYETEIVYCAINETEKELKLTKSEIRLRSVGPQSSAAGQVSENTCSIELRSHGAALQVADMRVCVCVCAIKTRKNGLKS